MRILITGVCGFVGSALAREFVRMGAPVSAVCGVDNLARAGSETNRRSLKELGVELRHGDLRIQSDVDALPPADWVVDAAAVASVLSGVDGSTSSRQLIEHNLLGTINVLEYCKRNGSGLVLLSTSRVYSLADLSAVDVTIAGEAFTPDWAREQPAGLGAKGLTESFSTAAPVSLYGATKIGSEQLALEYGNAFGFPVRVNRCGVLAGAGQFGRADQGIFSYWIHAWAARQSLAYIGFGGAGHQVRDCLHVGDLARLVATQVTSQPRQARQIVNVGGGVANSCSLAQLSEWCSSRLGAHTVTASPEPRPFDAPWIVMDSSAAKATWDWEPAIPLHAIFEEIAMHATAHPDWLSLSS